MARRDADQSRPTTIHAPAVLSRRGFLALSGAAGAGVLLAPNGARATPAPAEKPIRTAKNLIFMVSDGMSNGTLQLADLFIRRRDGRASHWLKLIENPLSRRAIVNTSAANSVVTDSAAAATAWGVGELVNNGSVGLATDGRKPETILMKARRSGRAIGLVTTARLTHATPAGFLINSPFDRDKEDFIAEQMVTERLPEVAFGGGAKFLTPEVTARGAGLTTVRTRAEWDKLIAQPRSGPVMGVFNDSHLSMELDRVQQSEAGREPSIEELTRAALAMLKDHPGGFAIQIEGGRIDHAAHYNDAGSLVHEQMMFDRTIGAVMEFASKRDDTLVIVTTDHGNANPGLTDYEAAGDKGLEALGKVSRSFEWIHGEVAKLGQSPERDAVASVIERGTGVTLDGYDLGVLTRRLAGDPVDPFKIANPTTAVLGSILANHFKVAFLSVNHTSDYVELTAIGPGSELVPPTMKINEVHGVMVKALGM
ncbi:MAG TPA: alkaline phosphatase [Phycisphaerales bacterium]|nr:alkaline phosphatase [Phycisphaerales bacterium]